MTPPPTSIDGTDITGATIDGQDVQEITVDGQTVFLANDVPFFNDLHARYDFSTYSGTSNFADLTGNGFDLVNGSISSLSPTINGKQAADFNGTNDALASNTFGNLTSPYTVSVVCQADTASFGGRFGRVYNLNANNNRLLGVDKSGPDWQVNGGGDMRGSGDMTIKLLTVVFDSTTILRENGTQTVSSAFSDIPMDRIQVGFNGAQSGEFWGGQVGELLIYPDARSISDINQIENYLAGEWGITI